MNRPPADCAAGLAGNDEYLRSILATVPDAMIIIGERGTILSFSAAAEKMFGYAEAEVVGENVSILMPSPDRERHDSYLENYRKTGVPKIIGTGRVTTGRRRDGNTFPIELSVGEAWVDGERVFTGFIHDITQAQQTEVRLQDLQAELAHVGRVSEMGTFASSLAHELNQPLTAISNFCEGVADLLEGSPGAQQVDIVRQTMKEIAAEAVRAGEIVRRMREFISHGHTEFHLESLPKLISEANALALVGSHEQGIDVQVTLDARADRVFVDRIQIQQVLFNLIRNAIEAMAESDVRSLTIATSARPKEIITVRVEDSGPGIDESVAERLFQPFVTSKKKGMGIGLSICRTIVEAHGGRIWCEAGEEGGTIFKFTLPAAGDGDGEL